MEKEFDELLVKIKRYNPAADFKNIRKAWEFAKLAHSGQKRKSGDPYSSHPLAAASILTDWRLDETSIVAALLHDSVEDGGAKREDIVKEFSEEAALLVDGVTKVSSLKLRGSAQQAFIENLRKLILVMAKDLRVVLVKLADRMHNMQTLSALSKAKQKRIAQETLDIYAPLAERFGIGEVKGQLEDLTFPYLYPEEYERTKKLSKVHYKKTAERIKKMRRTLLTKLAQEDIKAKINAREKHLYSLWRKLERKDIDWDFGKIQDIIAIRIIVSNISQCYTALGVVHQTYKPIPNIGVSDFISQPKPNGYRSLHTKVFGVAGNPVEVQIRTHKMHEQAEFGVAAHWAYAESKAKGVRDEVLSKKGVKADDNKLAWVKQLVEWQKEISDSKEFMKAVKFDALAHRNFVFSPKGDVYDLPANATPVDFATAVHTDLLNFIKSAKVNGKIAPLSRKLKSGDVVEIVKIKQSKKPSRDWLEFVVTETARRGIIKYLRKDA